jgi:uncharacterized membrane protein
MTTIPQLFVEVKPFVGPRLIAFYAAILITSLPVWPFGWHLGLHVLGAALLIGNALVMAVWLTMAGFRGSDEAKRRAARIVNRADAWFTVPGVLLLLLNGWAMAGSRYGGFPAFLGTDFIAVGLAGLTATGAVWALRLLPTQLALWRLATATGPLDRPGFAALLTRWYVWGVVATVLPISAAVVMAAKPNLW